MLGNVAPLWETMLAAMKLGAVVIPATTLLTPDDLADRFERGRARHVVTSAADTAKFDGFKQDLTRIAVGDAPPGWHRYDDLLERARRVHARRRNQCRRSAAALFHLRHDGEAQAGAALAPVLSDRPPVDDVRDRPAARRRPSQHLLPGLGQARLELLLRALERRRDGVHRTTSRGSTPRRCWRRSSAQQRHLALRAADGVAHADPGRPEVGAAQPARSPRRRRAAQPRGHRSGPRRLGPDHPRLLRPDRDHRADRQRAGPAGEARIDGPPAAGLSHPPRRRRRRRRRGRRDRHRARSRARRPDARLSAG